MSMSCSMITAVILPERTIDEMMSMIGAFSRVLTPLVGSSRKSSLSERVGHGHVEQLALPLRDATGEHRRLALQPELLEHLARFLPHGPIAIGQRRQPACL